MHQIPGTIHYSTVQHNKLLAAWPTGRVRSLPTSGIGLVFLLFLRELDNREANNRQSDEGVNAGYYTNSSVEVDILSS